MSNLKKALIIPDCHRPYHHKKAYNLMLKVALDLNPDEIVILGDYADFYAVNGHGKHPGMQDLLLTEIEGNDGINAGLDELDKLFPDAKKVYIEGNHEYRLERYITKNAPMLFGVTQWDYLFELNRRPNWTAIHYGPSQMYRILNSHLYARHEPLSMSSAKASAKNSLCNLVYGHIHRIEEAHIVAMTGENYCNFSVGWLGDQRKTEVFGYARNPQWALGFGVVYVNPHSKCFYRHKIHILENMTCVFNGKLYK